MALPKNILITPPGRRALELIEREIQRLRDLPMGTTVPVPQPLSIDAEVTFVLAELEARCTALMSMLSDADRPHDQRVALQTALNECIALRQEVREGLIEDQGGSLQWMWVSADPSITRGSRRFPQ